MQLNFEADYQSILKRIDRTDPIRYAQSRNYVDGDVSYLSPYISRGVISTRQVLEQVLSKGYALPQITSFVKELCWRDYFQRVAQVRNLNECIKHPQAPVAHQYIPTAVLNAATGIDGIDRAIEQLYQSGYVHNHCRMYIASVVCNIARSYWLSPARWMYYHLLDGDWASNACSWQWVAGANSHKKYVANQENINQYTHTQQRGSFLDVDYEALDFPEIPESLLPVSMPELLSSLPASSLKSTEAGQALFVYNYYNLDPLWHAGEKGQRVLLLEPEFFRQYPVSPKCMDFVLALSANITDIQVFVGSFEELLQLYAPQTIYYKEHPLNVGYSGIEESRDWIAPEVTGYFPSFFSYWKKVEKQLSQVY